MSFASRPAFLAAGGNRHPSAADWTSCSPSHVAPSGSLLAYAADCNVALWDPNDPDRRGVAALLAGHTDTVNAVRFSSLPNSRKTLLLTGAVDKTVRAWVEHPDSPSGFIQAAVLDDHTAAVNAIAVLPPSGVFASAAADASICVWSVRADDTTGLTVSLLQKLSLSPTYFALSIDLAQLEGDAIVLAAAGTKPFVQVFLSPALPVSFSRVATLAGHEAWIRSLAFARETLDPSSDLLLASASQDKYVRLWRFHRGDALPAAPQAADDPMLGSLKKSLSNKAYRFHAADDLAYSITFEALLLGHEDWIFSARWARPAGRLSLLTASADSSLSVWALDPISGIWIAIDRLGDISSQKGATTATGSAGGFWTALWAPDGDVVVCLGRTGSWRLWRRQHDGTSHDWQQDFAVSGHIREVRDLTWSNDGSYLLSTSSDQTTRLFCQWQRSGKPSWHELSRPQIHGYDLNCLASLGPSQFISGADEKLLRVFNEPKAVADWLEGLSGRTTKPGLLLPSAANLPVLGLSNKVVDGDFNSDDEDQTKTPDGEEPAPRLEPPSTNVPPAEDMLSKHLLWPETEKLYGHGYEICAVAATGTGDFVATACRASSLEHAVIRLYNTTTWLEVSPPLKAHTLTVTALEFSPDDQYLVSVGRDRQCVLWMRLADDPSQYKLVASNPKAHARMILDASWAPLRHGQYAFATAGRDKTVHLWALKDNELQRLASLPAPCPVTVTSFCPQACNGSFMLAGGLENGAVYVSDFNAQSNTFGEARFLDAALSPPKPITALSWRTPASQSQQGASDFSNVAQLAIASEDASLRIIDVLLTPG